MVKHSFVEKLFSKEKDLPFGLKKQRWSKIIVEKKLTKVNWKIRNVALHTIISTGSTFVGAWRSFLFGTTFVRLVSLGSRCLSSAMM